jgi:hypothetical protein
MYTVPNSQCEVVYFILKHRLTLCVILLKEKFAESEAHVARLTAELECKSVSLFTFILVRV